MAAISSIIVDFTTPCHWWDYSASHSPVTVGRAGKMFTEVTVACFTILSKYLSEGTGIVVCLIVLKSIPPHFQTVSTLTNSLTH